MKQVLQTFILLFFSIFATAQITITGASFPEIGDTLRSATDNLPQGITISAAGPDQEWNFENLQAPFVVEQILIPTKQGVYQDQFPDANILVNGGNNGAELYYAAFEDTYQFLGYVGADPAGLDIEIIARNEPAIIERRAPLNYQDDDNVTFGNTIPIGGDKLPEVLLENLPITPDSLRIRVNSNRTDVVDAWGTLTIPGGTFEVLREKRIEIRETFLDVKVSILPWTDVTDIIGETLPGVFGVDTLVSYHFFSEDSKEAIAIVNVDETNTATNVTFKSIENTITNVVNVNNTKADIIAYPNPAIDSARFTFTNLEKGVYTLKFYNILGMTIWKKDYPVHGNKTVVIDLNDLRKGTYLYSVVDNTGKTLSTKRLIIIRP